MIMAASSSGSPLGALVGFIVWLAILIGTVYMARNKGRSPVLWGILAFFFSLIALIIVAVLPSRSGV